MKKLIILSLTILIGSNLLQAQFNGELDSTYAENGINLIDLGGDYDEYVVKSEFGSDGKLYVGGFIERDSRDIFIARFNADGTLDSSFGTDGKVFFDPSIGGDDTFRDLAITPDNKVLVVGNVNTGDYNQFIARFNTDGTIDPSFLGTGFTITGGGYFDSWETCLVDADNRILVAGYNSDAQGSNLTALRLLEDGSLDYDFGDNGLVIFNLSDSERFKSIIQTAPNRYYLLANIGGDEHVVALSGTGVLVNGFGDAGMKKLNVVADDYEEYFDIQGADAGSLIISGLIADANFNIKVMVVKLTSQGELDENFGSDGYYRASLGAGFDPIATSIHIQEDKSMLFTGDITIDNHRDFMSFFLSEDGFLDAGYGTNGLMTYDGSQNANESSGRSILDQNGDVFLYGTSDQNANNDLVIMKLKTTDQNVATKEVVNANVIQLNVFPNPVVDQLMVSFNLENNTSAILSIRDLNGRLVSNQDLGYLFSGENNLDLTSISSQLSSGFYLMTIETEHSIYTGKIVKQ